jgi:hypothetical protein
MSTGLGEIVLYRAADGGPALDVRLERDTVWLTQAQMAELFGRERSVLTKHVNNVFKEGELDKESNVQILHIAGSDKPVSLYNLDGNKRIAAALFLWFLQKNQALYRADGGKRIADNALVAMTLLIAESRPDEKAMLTRVVVNLINRRNP